MPRANSILNFIIFVFVAREKHMRTVSVEQISLNTQNTVVVTPELFEEK